MPDPHQFVLGGVELLAYVIFLLVYAVAIDPAWSQVDAVTHWLLGDNPQLQKEYDIANGIVNTAGQIEDTRTLIHKITNVLVFPIAPIGIVSRRLYVASNE